MSETFPAAQKQVTINGAASAPAPARTIEPVIEKSQEKIAEPAVAQFPRKAHAFRIRRHCWLSSIVLVRRYDRRRGIEGWQQEILLGVVAAVVVAALAYAGWSHFQGNGSPAATPVATRPFRLTTRLSLLLLRQRQWLRLRRQHKRRRKSRPPSPLLRRTHQRKPRIRSSRM